MFKRLSIDGFRSFDKFEVDPLGRFNLIVGRGDSGKTNLLEAVFLACSNGDASLLYKEQELRRVQVDTLTSAEHATYFDLSWSVWNDSARFTIDSKWDDDDRKIAFTRVDRKDVVPILTESAEGSKPQNDNFPKDALAVYQVESSLNGVKHVGRMFVTPSSVQFRREGEEIGNINARYAHPYGQNPSRHLARFWSKAEDDQEDVAILRLLRSFDPNVSAIKVAVNDAGLASLRIEHKLLGRIPVEAFGAGFGKTLAIATAAISATNGVLIIDELDSSLHVGAQRPLIEFLLKCVAKHNIQLFASTHSLETLDAFLECFEEASDLFSTSEDFKILQVSKVDGRTQVEQSNLDEAKRLREELGLDLRRTQ